MYTQVHYRNDVCTSSLRVGLASDIFRPVLGEGLGDDETSIVCPVPVNVEDEGFLVGNFRLAFLLILDKGLRRVSTYIHTLMKNST